MAEVLSYLSQTPVQKKILSDVPLLLCLHLPPCHPFPLYSLLLIDLSSRAEAEFPSVPVCLLLWFALLPGPLSKRRATDRVVWRWGSDHHAGSDVGYRSLVM